MLTHRLNCGPRNPSPYNGSEEVPWSSTTATASRGLGKPDRKVKATLSLRVIEGDNGILCLVATSEIKGSTKERLRKAGIPWQF